MTATIDPANLDAANKQHPHVHVGFNHLRRVIDLRVDITSQVSALPIPDAERPALITALTMRRDAYVLQQLSDLPLPPRAVWTVSKVVIVERLEAAGKLAAARAALDAASLLLRERWNAIQTVRNDDPDALALLTAIGADPAVILA